MTVDYCLCTGNGFEINAGSGSFTQRSDTSTYCTLTESQRQCAECYATQTKTKFLAVLGHCEPAELTSSSPQLSAHTVTMAPGQMRTERETRKRASTLTDSREASSAHCASASLIPKLWTHSRGLTVARHPDMSPVWKSWQLLRPVSCCPALMRSSATPAAPQGWTLCWLAHRVYRSSSVIISTWKVLETGTDRTTVYFKRWSYCRLILSHTSQEKPVTSCTCRSNCWNFAPSFMD